MSESSVFVCPDKNGRPIKKGSKVKIVGSSGDCKCVYFTDEMRRFLNDKKEYTVNNIIQKNEDDFCLTMTEMDWWWDRRNVITMISEKPIKHPDPILFETGLLDIWQ